MHAARFAERRLQRSGRCHESEIRAALGREFTRYRSPDTLSDGALRDMIRNWHRGADRTATGWASRCPECSVLQGILHERAM